VAKGQKIVKKMSHPIYKVLVSRVVGGDDGEYVPVILLHYVKHDRGLLLYRGTKLEEHGMVILQEIKKQMHEKTEESHHNTHWEFIGVLYMKHRVLYSTLKKLYVKKGSIMTRKNPLRFFIGYYSFIYYIILQFNCCSHLISHFNHDDFWRRKTEMALFM